MRCALCWDEDKPLMEQSVSAWGEMQAMDEVPCYKEDEIAAAVNKEFFRGAKFAMDQVCNILDNMQGDGELAQVTNEDIQHMMSGELCMLLFSILDDQGGDDLEG